MKWKWLELINCHARCNWWWHEAWNQAICILKHALVFPVSACLRGCEWNAHQIQSITLHWANSDVISICVLNPTTHQCEAQDPQNNQNVGFIQMMPQWRPTAAIIEQVSETVKRAFHYWSCRHLYLRHPLHQPLLCSNPTTTFSFWQRIQWVHPPWEKLHTGKSIRGTQ